MIITDRATDGVLYDKELARGAVANLRVDLGDVANILRDLHDVQDGGN